MRTTLDIAEDVLFAAKERAKLEKRSVGDILTELARRGLNAAPNPVLSSEPYAVLGLQPFPKRGGIVTNELINDLRADDAY